MHELRRISLMNWNVLTLEDIEIGGTTAFIGAVGVGKSTILDALQTVLSGNQRSKMSLNRAASVQKSARSVKEYCLGITEETIALGLTRSQCRSMIALSFYETELKQHYSIGLLLYADDDKQHAETEERWVAPGVDFSFKSFGDRDASGNLCVLDPGQMLARVRAAAGPHYQTCNTTARSFVDAYLRGMRSGGGAAPNVEAVLMRFRNAIAFEEIQNPTQFVRSFILDEDPIDADSLRENLSHWDTISAKLAEIQSLTKEARSIRNQYRAWGRHEAAKLLYDLRKAWHTRRAEAICEADLTDQIAAAIDAIQSLDEEKLKSHSEIETQSLDRDRKKDRERALENSTERLEARHHLEASEVAVTNRRSDLSTHLSSYSDLTHLQTLSLVSTPALTAAGAASSAITQSIDRLRSSRLGSDERLSLIENARCIHSATGALEETTEQYNELATRLRTFSEEKARLEHFLSDTDGAGRFLSSVVAAWCKALSEAGIETTTLPDLVDITQNDLPWAGALEGALGSHRETIFVPADRVMDALDVIALLTHPDKSIIKLAAMPMESDRGAKSDPYPPHDGSITSIVTTTHPYVSHYLNRRLGSVSMVQDKAEFDAAGDAVMQDGTRKIAGVYASGVPADLLLGSLARRRRIDAARTRLGELTEWIKQQRKVAAEYQRVIADLTAIARLRIDRLEALLEALTHAEDALDSAADVYAATSSPEASALRAEISQHTRKISELQSHIRDVVDPRILSATKDKLRLETRLEDAVRKQSECNTVISAIEAQDQRSPYTAFRQGFRRTDAVGPVAEAAAAHSGDDDIDQRRAVLQAMTVENEIALLEALPTGDADYHRTMADTARSARVSLLQDERRREGYLKAFQTFIVEHNIDTDVGSKPYEDHFLWLCNYIERLDGNELRKYETQIAEKTAEVHREVREMLVLHLNDRLERAQNELRQLNKRLRQHRFEGLAYLFTWSIDPEMRPLYKMARQVAEDPNRANALLEDESDPTLKEAIETIRRIFSSDVSTQRFEDYRQYFTYEVRMTRDEVTEEQIDNQSMDGFAQEPTFIGTLTDRVGKGSGGQKQTPYYVAIAASMAAAYFPRAKKGDARGLGLVCFDEAFSKLDIRNTQALLRFFKSLNLQVVIAAPEEKRASFMELVDTIVDLYKEPGVPVLYLDSKAIGPKAREALVAANPEHKGIDGFRNPAAAAGEAI